MPRGDSYQLQGQQGGALLIGGDANDTVTGNIRWIQAISDVVLAVGSGETEGNIADLGTLTATIPAGVGIGGEFTKVKLTSGTAIAYYA